MAGLLPRIPLFKLYRRFGWPQLLPLNLTLSPSPKCNSRCLTCNIWMKRENELTLEEWEKVLASLGRAPYWVIISGGEPFMYPHLAKLAQFAYEYCRPGVINIPTNGILPSIPAEVERIARACPQSQVIINLSLDGVGEKHDFIRGVPGNFKKFEQRLEALLRLRHHLKNLTIGIHSVVSVFNVNNLVKAPTARDIVPSAWRSPRTVFVGDRDSNLPVFLPPAKAMVSGMRRRSVHPVSCLCPMAVSECTMWVKKEHSSHYQIGLVVSEGSDFRRWHRWGEELTSLSAPATLAEGLLT